MKRPGQKPGRFYLLYAYLTTMHTRSPNHPCDPGGKALHQFATSAEAPINNTPSDKAAGVIQRIELPGLGSSTEMWTKSFFEVLRPRLIAMSCLRALIGASNIPTMELPRAKKKRAHGKRGYQSCRPISSK